MINYITLSFIVMVVNYLMLSNKMQIEVVNHWYEYPKLSVVYNSFIWASWVPVLRWLTFITITTLYFRDYYDFRDSL